MEYTTIFIAITLAIAFFSQGVAGFAAGLIAMPLLIMVLPVQTSVALMTSYFFVFSCIFVFLNRKLIDKQILKEIGIGIFVGLCMGTYGLKYGNPLILKKVLGVFILGYVIYYYSKKKKIALFNRLGWLFGWLSGLFGGLFATGGPPIVIYANNRYEQHKNIRANIIVSLGIADLLRFILQIQAGILTTDVLWLALKFSPIFVGAILLGNFCHHYINEQTFKNIIVILLGLSAINLLIS